MLLPDRGQNGGTPGPSVTGSRAAGPGLLLALALIVAATGAAGAGQREGEQHPVDRERISALIEQMREEASKPSPGADVTPDLPRSGGMILAGGAPLKLEAYCRLRIAEGRRQRRRSEGEEQRLGFLEVQLRRLEARQVKP